jgi:arsenite methyltransferase
MLAEIGFTDIEVGPAVDTFGGAPGEANARTFDVRGYAFIAHKPAGDRPEPAPTNGAQP